MKIAKGFRGRYFSLAAIAATVSCIQLQAQDVKAIQLERVVVSAANSEQDEEDVTEDVTVITADEIQERGYITLKDALASVPGISFTSNGGYGQPTSIYLRGLNSDQTLVLIDGVRANDVTGLLGAQFETILLGDVERIEVIKGAQSGVWGADASAGVVNIVTKGTKKGLSYGYKFGTYDTRSFNLSLSDKRDRVDYSLSLSSFQTKGFSAAEPGSGSPLYGSRGDDLGYEEDPYTNRTYIVKLGYDITEKDRVEASLRAIDAKIHYDSIDFATGKTVDAPDGPFTLNSIKNRFYNAGYIREDGKNRLRLFYNYSTFNRTQYGGYSGHIKEVGAINRYDYANDSFFQAGVGYQGFSQGLSAGSDLGKKYANRYIFATNYNTLFEGRTIVSESVRYDNYTNFENKLTYKAGIKQYLFSDFGVSANYSTGYNVPTLYRLYDSWVGNQELKPESTRGYDAGLFFKGFKALYFSQRVEDLIDYNYSTFKYYNEPGSSKFKGIELSYSGTILEDVAYDLGYTRLLKAQKASGDSFARRAKNSFNYSFTWFAGDKHTVNLNGYYVGERFDDVAKKVQTGKYGVTNIALRHNFAKGYTGQIEVRNIFDRFYQEVDGYGTSGRAFYIGISAKL